MWWKKFTKNENARKKKKPPPLPPAAVILAESHVDSDPNRALTLCDIALGEGQDGARVREIRGRAMVNLGHYSDAWADLEQSRVLGRSTAALFRARWASLYNRDMCSEALSEIERAIREAPEEGEYQYCLARTLGYLNRWSEVLNASETAIRLEYDTHFVQTMLGHSYYTATDYRRALLAYEVALRYQPDHLPGLVYAAKCLWQLDRKEEAEERFDAADRAHPTDPEPRVERGRMLFSDAEFERAADCLDHAVELNPKDKSTRLWRSASYCQLGLYDLAIDEVDDCLSIGPGTASEFRWRGEAKARLREFAGALADFDRSLELEPKNANAHDWRGWIFLELERWDEALLAYHEAIRLDPTRPSLYEQRSRVWDKLGCENLAASDFETVIDLELKADPPPDMSTSTEVYSLVHDHFSDVPLDKLSLTERFFPARVSPDVQRALDSLASSEFKVDHFICPKQATNAVYNFQALYTRDRRNPITASAPLHYEVDIGEEKTARCLWTGTWLLTFRGTKFALLTTVDKQRRFQVAAPATDEGEAATSAILKFIEAAVATGACYRGKVLSLEIDDEYGGFVNDLKVHRLKLVRREDVILPQATLDLLDRNVIKFARARSKLRDLGMATKKGMLFFGPPGTGKTHTIHYLARALPDTTTFVVTAEQIGYLSEYMTIARLYQPSLVVLEDVDLIARERRSLRSGVEETLLNRLLNEMDGLRPDADIIFILTTNAPEALEEALSNRPGRVDQGIEFPYPDAEGRIKLVRMYAGKTTIPEELIDRIASRKEPMSPAFIKELMRRAAQSTVLRDSTVLSAADIDSALDEMLNEGSLNARLFGFRTPA